ncbi:MAG: GTP-binding protein [Rhodobacteraceae bacterium]|nr:GTP-binding protein [Paracoccaceae bacterium]
MVDTSVPILAVGGFLGSGKTSLINNLLRQADGRRIVVFVNDFGTLNIDYDLIETVSTDRIALSNGCVCCTLNDDLIRLIARFCETVRPDMFVIEASGVADPRALDTSLVSLQQVGLTHMRRRIYVIDADQFGRLDYADTEDIVDHAAASDLVVLNKSDLVHAVRLRDIEMLLQRSAPAAAVLRTSHGEIALESVAEPEGIINRSKGTIPKHQNVHDLYETCAFKDFPHLSNQRFQDLTTLLTTTCLRAKGIVYFEGAPNVSVHLQIVGCHLDIRKRNHAATSKHSPTKLVVIGWAQKLNCSRMIELLKATPLSH